MTAGSIVPLAAPPGEDAAGPADTAFDAAAAIRKLDLAAYNIAAAGLAHVQAHFARAQARWNNGTTPMELDRLERLAKTLERYHATGRTAARNADNGQGRLV